MKKIILIVIFLFITITSLNARNIVDIVTFADFSRVRDISVSLSHVYFVTTEGVIRYNKLEDIWEEPLTGVLGVDYRDIFRVYVDQFDKKLYARTELAAYEYDILFEEWYNIAEIPALDNEYIHIKPPRIMFAPTGYNYTAEGSLIDQFGRKFQISDMVDDRTGTVWMGMWGYGTAVTSTGSGVIDLMPYGLIQNRVNTIFNDRGLLLIGGDNFDSYRTGITFFDPDYNEFDYLETGVELDFPAEDINCFEADDAYYYIGTSGGLFVVERENLRVESRLTNRHGIMDDEILSLQKNGDSLFIGTAGGLNLLIGTSDSLSLIRPKLFVNTEIYDFELTDSTLWIASSNGAYQMYLKNGKLQQFQDPHLIIFNRAYTIERFGHELFLASDGGMIRLNLKNGDITPFKSISGGYRYRALAVNNRVAVLGSDNGFTLYFLNKKGIINEREFTISDGLPSDRIYSLLLDGDFLWIGTDKGLSRFLWNDPDRID